MISMPFGAVRKATLADVAAVARLSARSHLDGEPDGAAPLHQGDQSAPEIALRLLEDLDDGGVLYVAELERDIVGYAEVTGLMVGDGGHLVELRRLYVAPERRGRGLGRRLVTLVLQDLAPRGGGSVPALRAWAPFGSRMATFLEMAGGTVVRQRWKVSAGDTAMRGVVFGWSARPASPVRGHALA
jgi:GNAT superfamily N-acetyltransferase